jgi:transposase
MRASTLPTPDDVRAAYQQGEAAVLELVAGLVSIIRACEARAQGLAHQLAKNSRNSSKPPSSDGLSKPAPRSVRQSSSKPSGGQAGHVEHRLEPVDKPRYVEVHPVLHCGQCQADLAGIEASKVEKRQVIDLPEREVS